MAPHRLRRHAADAGGNLRLLRYEQRRIIGGDYDAIRNHSDVTWLLTLGMSVVAESPIDRGRPFREVVPYEVELNTPDRIPVVADQLVPDRIPFTDVRIPGGEGVHVDTPDQVRIGLPINNVSIFEKRWQWIGGDMYPAWVTLAESGTAGDLVATPIEDLAAERRIIPDSWLRYEAGHEAASRGGPALGRAAGRVHGHLRGGRTGRPEEGDAGKAGVGPAQQPSHRGRGLARGQQQRRLPRGGRAR